MKVNCEVAFLWEKEKKTLDSQLAPLSSVAAAVTLKSPRRDGKEKKIEDTLFIPIFLSLFQVRYKQDLAIPSRSADSSSSSGMVTKLPEECIREILLKLSDPRYGKASF